MNYFSNKDELSELAKKHTIHITKCYAEETKDSIKDSIIYGGEDKKLKKYKGYRSLDETVFRVVKSTSNQAIDDIVKENEDRLDTEDYGSITVLNFASFKHPGGKVYRRF